MAEFDVHEGLPKPGEQYEFTAHELEEFIKCAQDPVYFIRTYMKIIQVDRGLVPFDMYDFQEEMIRNYHENRFCITMCSRQVGKAVALDTEILTEKGWKYIRDIHPGDRVYTPKGTLTEVIAESPIFDNHDVYEVTFDTGDTIRADKNHLWTVEIPKKQQIGKGRKERTFKTIYESQTRTTGELKQILQTNKTVRIRTTQPLQFSPKELPLDPYMFGLWLGDGSAANRFTSQEVLQQMGVINNKHIPELYLQSSYEQRLSLLQGLMDTDGNSNGRGGCQFYQKANSPLVNDIRDLLWGLGIKHRIQVKTIHNQQYVTIQFSTVLKKNAYWYIKSIEQIVSIPVKCISVSDPDHLFLCGRPLIPTHNSTTVIGYFLHYILFNLNVRVCISANKQKTAVDLLGKLKLAYENLPRFLQQGVTRWARLEIELSNGSSVFAAATSSSAVRGGSYNILLCDEFAFVPPNIADEFYASTFPTITSGKTTKIIMVSTPNGMNLFHRFWVDAQARRNDFVPQFVHWSQVPGRDEQWKLDTIRNIGGPEKFAQEYECSFLSTSYTLISSKVLQTLKANEHVAADESGYFEFEPPDPTRNYIMLVDTSHGTGDDDSAFVIVDITDLPYRVVATYANNTIDTMEYPQVVEKYAKRYHHPWLMVEVMDVGRDVAFILFRDYEYPKFMATVTEKRLGQRLVFNSRMNRHLGLRMTAGVKRSGAAVLKTLIEKNKLIVNDYRIIQQLSTFVQRGATYMAETGHHDDLVIPLIMLSWASLQPNFAEITTARVVDDFIDVVRPQGDEEIPVKVRAEEPDPVGVFGDSLDEDDPMWLLR